MPGKIDLYYHLENFYQNLYLISLFKMINIHMQISQA